MKTIMKTLLVSIASLSLMFSVNAGELTVSGTAKATYNATSGNQADNGIGVTNELNFTASGEMDNGYTWSYSMELDPASGGAANNDDTRLEIGTDMGAIGLYITEGGMSKELHGVGAMGPGFDYHSPATFQTGYDVDGYGNIQYHSPADALPFGAQIKLGYVPDMNDSAQMSAKMPAQMSAQMLA